MLAFLIPYQVDVPMERWPIANWILIGVTVIVSIAVPAAWMTDQITDDQVDSLILDGWNPVGLVGHIFLHSGPMHLIGNMVFLFVFGNAVCAKVGNTTFAASYLLLGLIAAATHVVFDGDPAIGASGAVNGVVGMYLILYPRNDVVCGYFIWFYYIIRMDTFRVASIVMILVWFAFDLIGVLLGNGGVAYMAHIGGLAGGAALATMMLSVRWIEMDRAELSLLEWIGGAKLAEERRNARAISPRRMGSVAFRSEGYREPQRAFSQEPTTVAMPRTKPVSAIEKINIDHLFNDDSPFAPKDSPAPGTAPAPSQAADADDRSWLKPGGGSKLPDLAPLPEITPLEDSGSQHSPLKTDGHLSVQIRCQCGKILKAPGRMAGKTVCCPNCKRAVTLPER